MRFEWQRTDGDAFERAVELFLECKHEKATTAFAPDGRGGDGGVDFWARTRRSLTIYQLKHYTDGFLSSTRNRKRDVKDSFEKATQHSPSTWVLVVPAKLTTPEREYVLTLKAPAGRRQPHIQILDLPKLEYMLVKYPEVRAHLDREPLLDAIEERQIEVAEPRSVDEVLERAAKLAERGGHIDPDWGMDLFVTGGIARAIPRAKRGGAANRSPLGLELHVDASQMSIETRAVMQRSVGYGTGEAVLIPEAAIVSVRSTGPSWEWFPGGDLELIQEAPPAVDAVVLLELLDADGGVTGRHEGLVTRAAPGSIGASLDVSFYTGMGVQLLLPQDPTAPVRCSVSVSVHRLFPSDARDALALLRALRSRTHTMRVFVEGQRLFQGTLDSSDMPEPGGDLAVLEQFSDDFAFLQEHTGVRRRLPTSIPVIDRVMARAARLVLEGQCAFLPPPMCFAGTISTAGDPRWDDQLRATLNAPHAMYARLEDYTFDVCGIPIAVGPVAAYSPGVHVGGADRLLRLLEEGTVEGERIEYVANDDAGWRVTRLAQGMQAPEDAAAWRPVPWDLINVAEHPALDPSPSPSRLGEQ